MAAQDEPASQSLLEPHPIEPSPEPDRAVAAMTAVYASRGMDVARLAERADGTLSAPDRLRTIDSETLAAPAGSALCVAPTAEPLVLSRELGRGGMGAVHLAQQGALRREVAVKRATGSGSALHALLKEAWVGASLEHPSVVPVHVLARIDDAPAVVMKRIEGQPWSRFLRDPSLLPPRAQSDPLGWHARILVQVCHAIARAHEGGVLHLDLKPDNVMVGSFGEVYVLDWGLAAAWGDHAPQWLGRAADVCSVAGTPEYMAPELALGAGEQLSPQTDVYLLGAILHEVVTGAPPHVAPHVMARLYHAFTSAPHPYGQEVPAELAAILHRALHREPAERFATTAALREALETFLAQRVADELVRDARTQLCALETQLDAGSRDESEIWHCFGACRFALREALSSRPDHPEVASLRASLHRVMARWALSEGRLELARSYLSELPSEDVQLEAELARLRSERDARAQHVQALEAFAQAEDLSVGSALRERIAIALGFFFLAINLAMAIAADRGLTWGYRELAAVNLASFCVLAPYGVLRRREIFRNRANNVFFAVCIATWFVVQGYWMAAARLGVTASQAVTMTPVFYLLAFGSMAALVSARFVVSALIQIPTILAAAWWPEHAFEIIGVGGGASAALVGVAWKDPADRASAPARSGGPA